MRIFEAVARAAEMREVQRSGYEVRAPATLRRRSICWPRSPAAWRPFAGGTDLMVLFEAGQLDHQRFLSIWRLAELRGIAIDYSQSASGALTTYTDVLHEPRWRRISHAGGGGRATGGIATQNRGTIGGNIVNARPPPILRPRCWFTMRKWNWSPRAARGGCLIASSIPAISRRLSPDEMLTRIRLSRDIGVWRH